jgi:hypothetical protein
MPNLHLLSLADGSQTQLVGLGLSGSWTAPWDASPDGTHLLYHSPGADSLSSALRLCCLRSLSCGRAQVRRPIAFLMALAGFGCIADGWLEGSVGFSPTEDFVGTIAQLSIILWIIGLLIVSCIRQETISSHSRLGRSLLPGVGRPGRRQSAATVERYPGSNSLRL